MAEELALHQLRRNRAAVDRHERLFAPPAGVVNHPCNEFLAGARFAANVHRGLAAGDALDDVTHTVHNLGVAEQRRGRLLVFAVSVELQRGRNDIAQIDEIKRLGQEVESAEALRGQLALRGGQIRGLGRVDTHGADRHRQQFTDVWFVIDDQNMFVGMSRRFSHCFYYFSRGP